MTHGNILIGLITTNVEKSPYMGSPKAPKRYRKRKNIVDRSQSDKMQKAILIMIITAALLYVGAAG